MLKQTFFKFSPFILMSTLSMAVSANSCFNKDYYENYIKLDQARITELKAQKDFILEKIPSISLNGTKVDTYKTVWVGSKDTEEYDWWSNEGKHLNQKIDYLKKYKTILTAKELSQMNLFIMNSGIYLVPKGFKPYDDYQFSEWLGYVFINDNNEYITYNFDAFGGQMLSLKSLLFSKSKKEAESCQYEMSNKKLIKKNTMAFEHNNLIQKLEYKQQNSSNQTSIGLTTYSLSKENQKLIEIMDKF